jgi:hypothetical protein
VPDPSTYKVLDPHAAVPPNNTTAPDPSTFRFWISTKTIASTPGQEILVIDVEQSINPKVNTEDQISVDVTNFYYGSFEMRGSQVFVANPPNVLSPPNKLLLQTLMTSFGKVIRPKVFSFVPPVPTAVIPKGTTENGEKPLLARLLSDSDTSRSSTLRSWTISFEDSTFGRPTGFITEADYGDALGSKTFFAMPPFRPLKGLEDLGDPPLPINYFYHASKFPFENL